jgi:hypothetical protein
MLTLKIRWQRLVDNEDRTCPRCGGTEEELNRAYLKLKEVLSLLDIEVVLEKKELTIDEFKANPLASNHLWIGDKTLEEWLGAMTGKSPCCDVCGDNDCRTVEIGEQIYETIPASMIIKAGLIAAAEMLPSKIQSLKEKT